MLFLDGMGCQGGHTGTRRSENSVEYLQFPVTVGFPALVRFNWKSAFQNHELCCLPFVSTTPPMHDQCPSHRNLAFLTERCFYLVNYRVVLPEYAIFGYDGTISGTSGGGGGAVESHDEFQMLYNDSKCFVMIANVDYSFISNTK